MQTKKVAPKFSGNASWLTVGIVVSEYNPEITDSLLEGALEILQEAGVGPQNIHICKVAGSFEIPFGCLQLIKKRKVDTVIALGCIVKGETKHDEYIAHAVAGGIMHLSLKRSVPIAFGVLTTNTLAQAKKRSRGASNKGREAAVAALNSALL